MKKIIYYLIFSILFIINFSCNSNYQDTGTTDLKLSNIKSVLIKTQLTDNPPEKLVVDKKIIKQLINLITSSTLEQTVPNQNKNDWHFWLEINGIRDDIVIYNTVCYIGKTAFKTKDTLSDEVMEIYTDIETEKN